MDLLLQVHLVIRILEVRLIRILVEVGRLLHEVLRLLSSPITVYSLGATSCTCPDLRSLCLLLPSRYGLLLMRGQRGTRLHNHLPLGLVPRPLWLGHGIGINLWILTS